MNGRSVFAPYPMTRGPAKVFLYGDPGTEKTRRALRMPGPRYMIDLEKGADEYGDLTEAGDQYVACGSSSALLEALDELDRLPAGTVGTVIVDPITVLWQSLQTGHTERTARRKKIAPEEVMLDQGVWSRLNRSHGDVMTRLLNAPYHVVYIARGKVLRNDAGAETGYAYDGHKSLDFLAKTVIASRSSGDVVVKDRTGTWREGRHPRLDLRELVARAGTGGVRLQTPSEGAEQDAREPKERWSKAAQAAFCAELGRRSLTYEAVAALCTRLGRPRPSQQAPEQRASLLSWLDTDAGKAAVGGAP